MSSMLDSANHGEIPLDDQKTLICPFETDIFTQAHGDDNHENGFGGDGARSITPAPYTPNDAGTELPVYVLESLPTIMHDNTAGHSVVEVVKDIETFIKEDLDVSRLNVIHSRMWMCGRPLNARGLHRQEMMNRKVMLTEQADLHLLYYESILLVKPLPAYLLCPAVWTRYLKDPELHKNAAGFLLSYIWLLKSPLDFRIAQKLYLIPNQLKWPLWKKIVAEFLNNIDANSLDQVNKRYQFGELRLGRINTIYRLSPGLFHNHFVRGYLYGYNRYVVFFKRNVGWVLVVFVWFSLILSAMQVGTTVEGLQGNKGFNRASYGFVVFSIVLVAALLAFIGVIFVAVFLYNMGAAIHHARTETKRRKELARKRAEKKDV